MKSYDWIVIGGGITGSALAYELSQQKFKVLLLEKDSTPDNATVYSYGGLAYWSGTTALTRQLCQEGIDLHRNLQGELDGDTEFREIDLLLTIHRDAEVKAIARNYNSLAITPQLLDIQQTCEVEPLLNPNAIAGALQFPHGQINPQKTAIAYQQAFLRQGGVIQYETVQQLLRQENTIQGVVTKENIYYGENTVVCSGGLTRSLLKQEGITVQTYFTHAQVIKTVPTDWQLRTIVMPAVQQRFTLEAITSTLESESAWDNYDRRIVQSILDPGAAQMQDSTVFLGQISAISTNPETKFNLDIAESEIRRQIAEILPKLSQIRGTCHHCLVAFSTNKIASVGKIQHLTGIYLFSGFTSTLVYAPPLAKHFAKWVSGEDDSIILRLNQELT